MALDPRIALQGASFQAPDILGAMRQGQEIRQNQMAQQAAQATAARNAMIQQRAAQTDFNDPASVRNFAAMGPGTEDYLSSVTAGDTMFTSRDTNRRAESEARIKQDEAGMVELRTVVGRVFANPDDASLADAAQRYPQFAADINRIAANPDAAARRTGLATLVASLPGGSEFLDAVTQEYTNVDLGGTTQRVPNRTYLPGEVQSFTKTPDPTPKTQLVQLADGTFAVVNLGTAQGTTATSPGGTPLVGRVPGAEGQITAQRRGQLQGQINTVNNDVIPALDRMDTLLATGDVITGAGAEQRLLAARGLALLGNQDAQRQAAATQEYQNLAKSLAAGMAKTLGSNPSNADVALLTQVTGGMIGQETPALQATSAALRARANGLLVDAQDMLGIEAEQGGGGAAPAGGGGSPPRVTTRAQYDALASGEPYIDPNGVRRTKQ